jgi:hypothetical protein
MPRIEFQISTSVLLETLQQLLEPRLYAQCFVSPIQGLYLDHIEVGVQGPITQPSNLGSTSLNVAVSAKVFVVTAEEVQAAQGGPPVNSLTPGGIPLTANIVASLSGTKFNVKYDGIVHDSFYNSLLELAAGYVGSLANAKQLFSQAENTLKHALDAKPLIVFDFVDSLPPQVKNLPNGRSALCANSKIVAARFEVGSHGSDGSWHDFHEGTLGDLIGRNDWGVFISGDVLVGVVDGLVQTLVNNAAPGIPFGILGTFGLLAGSGPLPYYPQHSIVPRTASVTTTATVDFTVKVTGPFGIDVFSDQGDIELTATLIFTVNKENQGLHAKHSLDTSLYYTVQVVNNPGGLFGDILGILGLGQFVTDVNVPLPSGFESGLQATEFPNFYTHQTPLPPVVVENILTLTVSGCTGIVESPASSSAQKLLDSLSTGTLNGIPLPAGTEFAIPRSGLLIFGQTDLAPGKSQPDCGVRSTPFALMISETIGPNGVWIPVTPENVPATGTFSVYNKGPHASRRYPLIIGAFSPVSDPALQWLQSPSLLPQVPLKARNIVVKIPEAQFRPAYMAGPYPLSLIVCTNGGARFVSLGKIPKPEVVNGLVENAQVVETEDSSGNPPPTGPQHPVTGKQAPSGG